MPKVRVSLSLDKETVSLLDSYVDGFLIRNRSSACNRFIREHLADKRTAVILAGGNPKSLVVSGLSTFRPLVKIGERTLIEDTILKCRAAEYSNIIVVGSAQIISKLYEVLGNGKKFDVSIRYVEEEIPMGSAKTLEKIREFVKSDFLFIPCDHYFDFDLKKIRDFHKLNKACVTLAIHTRTSFEWGTSIVEMDGYNITNYEEYPKKPKTHLVSTFIGFASPEVFSYVPPGSVKWSLQEHIFPKLAREGKLCGYPVSGQWVNLHTKKDLEKVKKFVK